jgi:hypothetical protein
MKEPVSECTARPALKLPDLLEPFLTLLDEPYKLPVCRSCQAALLPKSVMDHLRKHHRLSVELRTTVRSLVATLPPFDFKDVPQNLDGSASVDALRVVDAFQCKHCAFIRRDVTDVRKHINQEHEITAAGNYDRIQAQSWFGGRRAVYWRVRVRPTTTTTVEEGCEKRDSDPAVNTRTVRPTVEQSESNCRFGFFGKGFGPRDPVTGRPVVGNGEPGAWRLL